MTSTTPQKKVVSKTSIKSTTQKVASSVKDNVSAATTTSSAAQISASPAPKALSPANTDKKLSSVKSIGMVLKQVRESKSLKVSEISQRLRISERYLHGIESMDVASLPEKVYALGFVRSYAQHLGVDHEKSLLQFKSGMYDAKSFGSEKKLRVPMPIDQNHMPSSKIMVFSALVLFSFLVVFGYWNQQQKSNLIVEDEISSLLKETSDVTASIAPLVSPPFLSENKGDTHYKVSELPAKESSL